jgi:DnaK suppressor protein
MDPKTKDFFRQRLLDMQDELAADAAQTAGARATVMLDQQAVGRLSRMDAIQQQAMAQATQRRREIRLTQIEAALSRLNTDEYGYCMDCGEDIAPDRLKANPTLMRCISCQRG